jgi:hypothetical protein
MLHLIEASGLLKHHECHRGFDWPLLFEFYDHLKRDPDREKVLCFLCLGIRRVFRMDQFPGMREAASSFCSARAAQFQDHPASLFYELSSLISSIGAVIGDLQKIVGAAPPDPLGEWGGVVYERVTFERQCHADVSFDSEISSVFCLQRYRSIDEHVHAFARIARLARSLQERISSMAWFQVELATRIARLLSAESSGSQSALGRQILLIVRKWTSLMAIVAHRQSLLMSYSRPDILASARLPRRLINSITSPSGLLELAPAFAELFTLILSFPADYCTSFWRAIAAEMFEEMKRGALTPTFLQYFRNGDYDHSPLLGAMLEIPAMHVDLILSPESSDCQLLYSRVMLNQING